MSDLRVAYLVSRYPALSHAFIEREIEGLRDLGAEVHTFTVRAATEDELLSPLMRREAASTTVLLGDRRELAERTWKLLRARPRAYATVLALAARSGPPHARGRLWQAFYLTEAVRLHHELEARGVNHLHVHFANNGADVARLVVALGRAIDGPGAGWRWTMTMHGPTELENVADFDLAQKVADADAVACISDFTRSQLMRLLSPEEWAKLHVVHMGVDTSRFGTHERSVREGPVRILNVGRLVPEKGAPLLLDGIRRLLDTGRDIQLRVVGAGPLETDLRDQVRRLGLADRVELMGAQGQDALPELYAWADLFCLPSFQEGLPVVLMEAMASGLPVVTTRIAGIPELVDHTNGRVVTAGRVDLLAAALAELVDDDALRRRLGREGRARVEAEFAAGVTGQAQSDFLSLALN